MTKLGSLKKTKNYLSAHSSGIISTVSDVSMLNYKDQALVINKEKERLLKIFIKNVPAAIAVFDKNMNYIITSSRWAEETNAKEVDVIGKNHYEVVSDIPQRWRRIHERGLKGEHLKCEEDKFKRKDGSVEWLRWEVLPWYKDERNIGGIIIFVEHITKRKAMEKNMLKIIKELNKSNSELERFAHICAHDLNEPLRTIANYSQIIEEEFKENLNPNAKTCIDNISKNVKHMSGLINGLLAYSQIGTPGLNRNYFSLKYVIDSIKSALDKKIKEKKAFIYAGEATGVYGDVVLIARVFQNLICNALKFNNSDIPIIYITAKERKSSWLFTVEDNGIGIEQKHHQTIFDFFSRLHSTSIYEGTGMGLSISKKIVKAHGGKIWVKSEPNKGATFFFTLPKNKSSAPAVSRKNKAKATV